MRMELLRQKSGTLALHVYLLQRCHSILFATEQLGFSEGVGVAVIAFWEYVGESEEVAGPGASSYFLSAAYLDLCSSV